MTVSASRTIVVQLATPTPWAPYIPAPPLQWPTKQAEDDLDYSLDLTAILADAGDYIASASVAMAPSNAPGVTPAAGVDAQPTLLSIVGNIVTVWIAGGVGGRTSMAMVVVETTMGRTLEYLVNLQVSLLQATYPLPAPYSLGFGATTTQPILVTAALYGLQTASGAYIGLAA